MSHGSGLGQGGDSSLARPQLGEDASPYREPPAEVSGKEQRPADLSGPGVCFTQPIAKMHSILRPLQVLV